AERRGLPNLRNTVDTLPVILRKDSVELFGKYRVYSERELNSRYNILCESYVKTVNVEARLTAMMAKTMILPAALKYQADVAAAVDAPKAAGVDCASQIDLLLLLAAQLGTVQQSIAAFAAPLSPTSSEPPVPADDAITMQPPRPGDSATGLPSTLPLASLPVVERKGPPTSPAGRAVSAAAPTDQTPSLVRTGGAPAAPAAP